MRSGSTARFAPTNGCSMLMRVLISQVPEVLPAGSSLPGTGPWLRPWPRRGSCVSADFRKKVSYTAATGFPPVLLWGKHETNRLIFDHGADIVGRGARSVNS